MADDQGIDVEASRGEDTGDAGEDSGFILHKAVQDVAFWGCDGRRGCFIEDVGDGCLGGPCWGCVGGGER